jgi:hypothetical protein
MRPPYFDIHQSGTINNLSQGCMFDHDPRDSGKTIIPDLAIAGGDRKRRQERDAAAGDLRTGRLRPAQRHSRRTCSCHISGFPLLFGLLMDYMGIGVLAISAGLSLSAFFALLMLKARSAAAPVPA